MQCIALTRSGDQCRRGAAFGLTLCPMHETIRLEAPASPPPHVDGPVDTLPGVPTPAIAAADVQPPLIAVIFDAIAAAPDGDDALGRYLADALAAAGGSHDDLEFLIEAGCAPDWTRGYLRALTPA